MDKAISDYFKQQGSKGGKKKGATKVRGDSQYYKDLAAKRKKKTTD